MKLINPTRPVLFEAKAPKRTGPNGPNCTCIKNPKMVKNICKAKKRLTINCQ